MVKLNFSCLVGSEFGYLKIINGYDWKVENELNLKIGEISKIKSYNDQFYLSSANQIYKLKTLSEDSKEIYYSPKESKGNIKGFDFIDDTIVVGFEEKVHVSKNNECISQIGSGKYNSFKLLRNNDIAIGGTNTELQIYNIKASEKPLFMSKGEPNKGLSLPAKVHICSIEQDLESDNIIYCGTKFNTVQLYDIRSNQRKAQLTANFEPDRSVTTISALSAQKIVAGSNGGCLGVIDFKFIHKTKKKSTEYIANYAKFKGFLAGSITDTQILRRVTTEGSKGNSCKDLVLSSSLDGHISVFDLSTREQLNKIHFGKKPSCLFVNSVNHYKKDDLWDDLDRVEDDLLGHKRKKSVDKIDSETSTKRSKHN